MPIKLFYIELDRPSATYTPGETIEGRVILELTKPKKCRGISISIMGTGKVCWRERQGRTCHTKQESYIKDPVLLVGSREKNMHLPAGRHVYPFNYILPTMLPCSFKHSLGRVEYVMEIIILDERVYMNISEYIRITIQSLPRISQAPACPINDEVYQTYSCWPIPCLKRGSINARIIMRRDSWPSGGELQLLLYMDMNIMDVRAIELQVIQNTTASTDTARTTSSQIVQTAFCRGPFCGTQNMIVRLKLNDFVPTGIPNCNIMFCTYQLALRFVTSDWHEDIRRVYDIEIKPKVPEPVVGDSTSLTPSTAPSVASSSSEERSGWVLPRPRRSRSRGLSKPVEAAEIELPPPSYESVMAGVARE